MLTAEVQRLETADPAIRWLLDGDPAIRWQTLRDLVDASSRDVDRARRAVATEGWGARLLALQGADGTWGGGLYTPKWTSTTYTLLLLRDFGLAPNEQTEAACARLLASGLRPDGGANFGPSPTSETCITGMLLSLASSSSPTILEPTPSPPISSSSRCPTAGGTAADRGAPRIHRFTPPSPPSKPSPPTRTSGHAEPRPFMRRRSAAASSCSSIVSSARTAPARSFIPSSGASTTHRAGTMTCCARSIIFTPLGHATTIASRRGSSSYWPSAHPMGAGRSRGGMRGRSIFPWSGSGRRAAGTHCERCGWWGGGASAETSVLPLHGSNPARTPGFSY
jgi:hypothetical protein